MAPITMLEAYFGLIIQRNFRRKMQYLLAICRLLILNFVADFFYVNCGRFGSYMCALFSNQNLLSFKKDQEAHKQMVLHQMGMKHSADAKTVWLVNAIFKGRPSGFCNILYKQGISQSGCCE